MAGGFLSPRKTTPVGSPTLRKLYEISGDADLDAVVHVDDTVALRDMLDRMWLAAPGDISSTQTELVLEQY